MTRHGKNRGYELMTLLAVGVATVALLVAACDRGGEETPEAPGGGAVEAPTPAAGGSEAPAAAPTPPAAAAAPTPAAPPLPPGTTPQKAPDMPEPAKADAAASRGGTLFVGGYTDGVFAAGAPVEAESKRPYIDYTIHVLRPGVHQIDIVSQDTGSYDPYVRLLKADVELAHNDDGGEGLQSQLLYVLEKGVHKVRVSSFGTTPPAAPVSYRLFVRKIN